MSCQPERVRTKSKPNGYGYYSKWYTPNGGATTLWEDADRIVFSDSERMEDVPTPNFRKIISDGGIVNSPALYVHDTFNESDGTYHGVNSSGAKFDSYGPVCGVHANIFGLHPLYNLPVLDAQPAIDDAKQQCVADINSTPYTFAEDSLEIASSVRYFASPGKSLYRLALDIQKRSWRIKKKRGAKARQIADALNDLYLEREYVLKPLVLSSFDLMDAMQDKLDRRAPRYNARGFASLEASYSNSDLKGYHTGSIYDRFSVLNTVTHKVHAYSLYSHEEYRGVLHKYGVRGDDGFVGLWNIVPLSFVVDQMYDISAFIQGLNALSDPRLRILASGYVLKTHKKGTLTFTGQVNPGWVISTSGTQTHERFEMTRVSCWHPGVVDIVPVFKPANLVRDIKSTANLFSLSAGILSRSLKPDRY